MASSTSVQLFSRILSLWFLLVLVVVMPSCYNGCASALVIGNATTVDEFSTESYMGVGIIMAITWGSVVACGCFCVCCHKRSTRVRRYFCRDAEWNGFINEYVRCCGCCESEDECCCFGNCDCCDDCVSSEDEAVTFATDSSTGGGGCCAEETEDNSTQQMVLNRPREGSASPPGNPVAVELQVVASVTRDSASAEIADGEGVADE